MLSCSPYQLLPIDVNLGKALLTSFYPDIEMDPTSILSLVASCLKISKTLYDFIRTTKSADRSISALARQTHGLREVLETLAGVVRAEMNNPFKPDRAQLWGAVINALAACSSTIRNLDAKLGAPIANASSQGFLKQIHRATRFWLNQDEIIQFLSAVQTHSINLQLALSTVQLMMAASAPQTIAHILADLFETLERMVEAVDRRLATQNTLTSTLETADNTIDAVQLNDTTKVLRDTASQVMTSASTATGHTSLNTSKATVVAPKRSPFKNFNINPSDQASVAGESTTGSEMGNPLASSSVDRIQGWIRSFTQDRPRPAKEFDTADSGASENTPLESIFSARSTHSGTQASDMTEDLFNEGSDDEIFEMEIVQNLFRRAKEMVQARSFVSAKDLIRQGLENADTLSSRRKATLDLTGMQLRLAFCCMGCDSFDDAEEILEEFIHHKPNDAIGHRRIFKAHYGLAWINLKEDELEYALNHSRQALLGQRRLKSIGPQHEDYLMSLHLSVMILYAMGEKSQAMAYSDQLPEDWRWTEEQHANALPSGLTYRWDYDAV